MFTSSKGGWIAVRLPGLFLIAAWLMLSIRVNGQFLTAYSKSDLPNRMSGGALFAGVFILIVGLPWRRKLGGLATWKLAGLAVVFVVGAVGSVYYYSPFGGDGLRGAPSQCAALRDSSKQLRAQMAQITAESEALGKPALYREAALVFEKGAARHSAILPSIEDATLKPIVEKMTANMRAVAESYQKQVAQYPEGEAALQAETAKIYQDLKPIGEAFVAICGREIED